jgi:beta-glucuronidase
MDLGGVWDLKLDNGRGFSEKWYERRLVDPLSVAVPASYNDLHEGVSYRDHYGWVFYQRSLAIPAAIGSQRIVLRCAAITHYTRI